MTRLSADTMRYWPVALLTAAFAAVPAALFAPGVPWSLQRAGYPVRFALPESLPPLAGASEAPPSAGFAVELPPGADPFGDPYAAGVALEPAAGGGAVVQAPVVPEAVPRVPAGLRPGGLLAVDFDLSDVGTSGAGGGGAIEISKAVRVNGADAGQATIRVSEASTLSIASEALGRLLTRAGRGDVAEVLGGEAGESGFIGFDALRERGIDVRYDAPSDRILISV